MAGGTPLSKSELFSLLTTDRRLSFGVRNRMADGAPALS